METEALKTALKGILKANLPTVNPSDPEIVRSAIQVAINKATSEADTTAENLATAIEAFVKSGTVSFSSGDVTGMCPSGGGNLTVGQASGGKIT